ncbi:hypothetical protein QJS10_CPB21g01611 [Acorus calamus]|uniref:Uncharacterized protein n=1 Tax=Acorus calamus TaxID=4465 RepID=A0AAV9C3C2_ACOCL|nr:hypothetical protein QJS10_CPB21g01611 [Acorus calamus]
MHVFKTQFIIIKKLIKKNSHPPISATSRRRSRRSDRRCVGAPQGLDSRG